MNQNKNIQIFSFFLLLLVCFSCNKQVYKNPEFNTICSTRQRVAVLPFWINYLESFTVNDSATYMDTVQQFEGKVFQASFYNSLKDKYTNDSFVRIQEIRITNKILSDSAIDLKKLKELQPQKICELLGVDAIVAATITKETYMNHLKELGLEFLGNNINTKNIPSKTPFVYSEYLPGNVGRTFMVMVNAEMFYAKDNVLLWNYAHSMDTDARTDSKRILQKMGNAFAKKFPYKIK